MAYTLAQLATFFTNANAGTAPTAAQFNGLQGIANQNATGVLTDAQALQSAIDMGSDVTTAVSVQTYQFFLDFAPSVAGLAALNAAYVGSGSQAATNGENRYIAQAVSLALQNPDAKAGFAASYGALSIADATKAAYNEIVGNTAAAAAGINVDAAVAFLTSAASVAFYTAFVKANVPGLTAAADIDLAVKAALVGEIIYQATIFNNGAGVGSYATAANNLIKDLADDGALTANNASGIALFDNYGVNPVAQTLTLTAAADTLNGAGGADTFVATNATLSAADSLTGGAGVDTLNYASNGAVAVNQAGFKAAGIETFNITSDATGGTAFDMSGVTGATRIVNDDSSFDLTVTGLNTAATLVVRNTSQSTATVNTVVNYNAAVTTGTTTTQAVVLENVFDPAQPAGTASKSAVTVNGVEIFNVTGSGTTTSNLTALASNSLTTVNIDGAMGVKIDALTFAGATGTVNGSANTGGINVVMTNSGATNAVVTGGTGADRADFSNGFTTGDSFNGGAGTDTVVLSQAVATGSTGGVLTAVEVLEVSTGGTGNVNLANFASIDTVNYTSTGIGTGNSLTGATTITNARPTLTVSQDAGTVGNTLSVALAANGAADNLTLNINKVGAADVVGAITAAQWDVIKVNVADDATVAGQGTVSSAGLTAANATSVTLTSDANVTFTGAVGGAALTSFDASTVTGKIDFTATTITTALAGATVKLGSGNDRLVVTATTGTATAGDTITLGAGADTVIYTAFTQSTDKTTDTITDFVSGTDKLDLIGLGLTSGVQFVGVRSSFALAQGALTTAIDGVQAVFQADTNTLWVDMDSNGQLDQSDFRIVLTGNAAVTAGDLSLGLTGNSITLNALAANVGLTSQVGATGVTTNDNDTVTTTIANLNGAVALNAAAGTTDTLVVSDAGTVAIAATVTNFESLTLANGTNTVSAAAASTIKNITGGTGADTVTATNFATGGAIALGTGADTLTAVTKAIVEATGASFDGGGAGIGTVAADIDTLTIANGVAAGTLDLTKASNFEVVNLGQGAGALTVQAGATANTDGLGSGIATLNADATNGNVIVNTTAAKVEAMTTVARTAGGNTFTINLTSAGTVNLVDTTVTNTLFTTLAANNTTFQVDTNAKAGALTANGAADVLNLTADLTAGGNVTLGGAGFETVNVSVAQTVNTLTFAATAAAVHNVSVAGAYTLGAAGTFNGTGTGNQTVTAANAATTATLAATGTNTYNGGTAADTVTVSGTATATVNGNAGADALTVSSSGAVTYVAGDDADTLTVTGSGAVTVTGGNGIDTFTLNGATASVDTIIFSDGGGVGIVAVANRDVVNNFLVANDKIQLDVTQTTVGTAAAAQPILQVVGTAAAFTASNTADITVVNLDLGGAVNVIGTSTDGSALINNTGAITIAANQVGYIVAYDGGNAYLYAFTDADANTSLVASEIALIGTFNGVAVGGLGAANFTLGA